MALELKIPQYAAVGIMEMLWHYTAKLHPQGDIGAAPDDAIAIACGWPIGKRADRPGIDAAKASNFIDALVAAGWLNRDVIVTLPCRSHAGPMTVVCRYPDGTLTVVCRLLVHDWHIHADESVKRVLKNRELAFFIPTARTENVRPPMPLPLPLPLPEPKPPAAQGKSGIAPAVVAPPTDCDLQEISDGYDRHLKPGWHEPRDAVIQAVLSMNGKFDWGKFRSLHRLYCEHYANHGWDYCKLSFLAWIEAGMPAPPPEAKAKANNRTTDQKSTYQPLPVYLPPED